MKTESDLKLCNIFTQITCSCEKKKKILIKSSDGSTNTLFLSKPKDIIQNKPIFVFT